MDRIIKDMDSFGHEYEWTKHEHEGSNFRLFVDDMRPIPDGWYGARTVSDTIRFLANFSPVAEISLDHDILFPQHGIDKYAMYSAENYSGVAYYIAAQPPELRPRKIRIHSSNSGAAMSMCDVMGLDFDTTYKLYDPKDYGIEEKASV